MWKVKSFLTIGFCLFSLTCFAAPKYKVIAFDAFPIFDPRPIFATTKKMFPVQGDQLNNIWRSRQFAYTWLRVAGSQYKDFYGVTEDALIYAAKSVGVKQALEKLTAAGFKLTFLSNFTKKMLKSGMAGANIQKYFGPLLSTDQVKTFKPDLKAYQMAIDKFKVKKEEILFVPFAAWDAVGAKWFGYDVFWINRAKQLDEQLDVRIKHTGKTLDDLVDFVIRKK